MTDKMHKLLIEILAAQVLTMQTLETIAHQLERLPQLPKEPEDSITDDLLKSHNHLNN